MSKVVLKSLIKIDGRKKNGAKKGEDRGGGRKAIIEKLIEAKLDDKYDVIKAEFWIKLANEKAVVRLIQILDDPKANKEILMSAIKETLNRSLGKSKESVNLTGDVTFVTKKYCRADQPTRKADSN